jgi:hypothetical protein
MFLARLTRNGATTAAKLAAAALLATAAAHAACSVGDDDVQTDTPAGCTDQACFLVCVGDGLPGGSCRGDLCICASADADADGDGDVGPDDAGEDDVPDAEPDDADTPDVEPDDAPVPDDGTTEEGEVGEVADDAADIPDVEAYDAGRRCTDVTVGWSFNGGVGSWTHAEIGTATGDRDPWVHGIPTGGPGGCRSGGTADRCWGTGLGGTYPVCQQAALRSPTIDLGPCAASPMRVEVTFYQWHDFGSGSGSMDGGTVEVTSDGGTTWTRLAPTEGWGGVIDMDPAAGAGCAGTLYPDGLSGFLARSPGWVQRTVPIPAEHRTAAFAFRFVFGSDGVEGGQGWFIDDVSVVVR